jgi:hypothetical protein
VIRWVTDKDWVLFEEVCDPGVLKEAEEKARKSAPKEGTFPVKVSMATHANLTDGSWKLKYIQGMEAANIFDPNHSAPGVTTTPFSGNMMGQNEVRSPGNLLKDCASGKQVCHTITTENLDGRQLILVALGESREAVTCRFWLDPDRGFVPIRGSVFASTGEELHRTYWSDIRKCSGDRWFPCHWLAISIPRRADAGFSVRELTVTSFEADKRPTPDAFRLTIPGGTQIIDPHTKYALFHLKTDESVRPDEIKKLHDRCLLTVPVLRALNETAQGENHWPFGTITLICAGSVFALFGGARWYKHRRFRSQAANNAPPPAVP